MSLVVVAVSSIGAAVAADSLRVQLGPAPPNQVPSAARKVRAGGRFVGGLAGVADHGTSNFLDGFERALSTARQIEDIPDEFLLSQGENLVRAYEIWLRHTGGTEPASEFCGLLVAQRSGPHTGAVLKATSAVRDDTLTFDIELSEPPKSSLSMFPLGAFPPSLYVEIAGRLAASPTGPAETELLELAAQQVVKVGIRDASQIPVPSWWPARQPVLAGPVQSLT